MPARPRQQATAERTPLVPPRRRPEPLMPATGQTLWSVILASATALLAFGVVMVVSAAMPAASGSLTPWALDAVAWRHVVLAGVAWVVMVAASRTDPCWWRWQRGRWFQPCLALLVAAVALLLAVYVPGIGVERNGAHRWVRLGGGLTFQPSELAKYALPVYLAAWMARAAFTGRSWLRDLLPLVVPLGVVAALIAKEDFGTGVLVAAVGGALLLVGGCSLSRLLPIALAGAVGMVALLVAEPYRIRRLLSFVRLGDDPLGSDYHVLQSVYAIASGGLAGQGLGGGLQKYGFLPSIHNDFIYALVVEELGLVGAAVLLGLFVVLVGAGMWVALRTGSGAFGQPCERERFASLLAAGIMLTIGLQAAMNVAVVTATVPTKGIALPLVSAGGSGLLATAAAVGLVAALARRHQAQASAATERGSPQWAGMP